MVTVRNDIEMLATAPDGTKVKDVNRKQEVMPARRRSYRCITVVGVVAVVLLSLAVGSVLLFEYVRNDIPAENSDDGSLSSTIEPEEATVHQESVPAFPDPFDGMSGQPEITFDPVEGDEIDIDGTPSTPVTTTTTEVESIDEGSGGGSGDDDNEDLYPYSGGSGYGDHIMS